jgi:hypothetical protein
MQAVGVEGVDARHLHVVDVLHAVGSMALHRGGEALAVELAAIAGEQRAQPRLALAVSAKPTRSANWQVVAADHQLVLGDGRIGALAALAVGQQRCRRRAGRGTGATRCRAQQHALGGLQGAGRTGSGAR